MTTLPTTYTNFICLKIKMQLGIMEIAMEPVLPVLNVKRKMVEQKVTVPVVLVSVVFSLRRHVEKKRRGDMLTYIWYLYEDRNREVKKILSMTQAYLPLCEFSKEIR